MSLPVAAPLPLRRYGTVHWLGLATLVRRELRRGFKEWLETVVAPAASTVLYLGVFALALGPERNTPEGAGILAFMLPGLVLFAVMIRASEATVFSLAYDKMERIISDVLMPPLAPGEVTAAYALAGTTAGLVTGVPALAAALLIADLPVASPALALLFAALSAMMLALAGIVIGLWTEKWDQAAAFFGFLLIPVTFLSGLFAPVDALPEPLAALVRLNPIYYAIDGFRAGFLGTPAAPVPLSLAVVGGTVLALWLVAGTLVRRGWRLKP